MNRRVVCAVALGVLFVPKHAVALDTFPANTVKIIVPTAPGGTADAVPRILAEALSAVWNRPIVIENVAGAGGNIGAELFSRAPADGHVLLATPPNALAINQSLYKKISYDPKTFEPIAILGTSPNVLITSPKLGIATVAQLIAKAKAEPGKISYASQGPGSTGHLTGALFETMAVVKLNHVPYRGTAPALTDLIGGHVDLIFDNLASSLPHHRSGALKIIAVCSAERLAALPEIPTVAEAALPGFQSISWFALVAPHRTPRDVIAKINADVAAALKTQVVQGKFLTLGLDPVEDSPADAAAFLERERGRWSQVIEKAGLKID